MGSGDRHQIQVTKQVKDNLLTIRTNIEVDPCTFGNVNFLFSRRTGCGFDVPSLSIFFLGSEGEERSEKKSEQ